MDGLILLSRDEVQRRKRCLLYMLIDYVHAHRGEWMIPDAQRQALSRFPDIHKERRTAKVRGKTVDGGPHTVDSLLEAIRTSVQQHARSTGISKTPIPSFFQLDCEALQCEYYQEIVSAYTKSYPDKKVSNHWATRPDGRFSNPDIASQQMKLLPKGYMYIFEPIEEQYTRPELLSQAEACADELSEVPSGLRREVQNLTWTELKHFSAETAGTRKRSYPVRFGSNNHQLKSAQQKIAPKRRRVEASPSMRYIRETPSVADYAGIEETSASTATMSDPAETQLDAPLSMFERIQVEHSKVKKRLEDINRSLCSQLRVALKELGFHWREPVRFMTDPSAQMERLYKTCFGKQWRSTVAASSERFTMESLDVLVALVGVAIHMDVFEAIQPWENQPAISFRLDLHREITAELLNDMLNKLLKHKGLRRDPGLPFDDIIHNVGVRVTRDPRYLECEVRPYANVVSYNVSELLYDHIRCQSSAVQLKQNGSCPLQIREAVATAIEDALLLKAELHAAGEEAVYYWYPTGTTFVGGHMRLSNQSEPCERPEGQTIAMTFSPRVQMRTRGGKLEIASPAIVSVFP